MAKGHPVNYAVVVISAVQVRLHVCKRQLLCRSCTGGKTEDFMAAAQLLHRAGGQVKVPTFLVPATQKVHALHISCNPAVLSCYCLLMTSA